MGGTGLGGAVFEGADFGGADFEGAVLGGDEDDDLGELAGMGERSAEIDDLVLWRLGVIVRCWCLGMELWLCLGMGL